MVGSTSNLGLRQLCPSCSKEGAMGWWEEGLKRAAGWKHIRVVIKRYPRSIPSQCSPRGSS